MTFNENFNLILLPFFVKNRFSITEERKNFFKLESYNKKITIRMGLFPFGANELTFEISFKRENYDIQDILSLYSKYKDLILYLRHKEFTKQSMYRLIDILSSDNFALLNEDVEVFEKLKIIRNKKTKEYNDARELRNLTKQINSSWSNRDYKKFIQLVETNLNKLPPSYAKKLEIAKKRLQ